MPVWIHMKPAGWFMTVVALICSMSLEGISFNTKQAGWGYGGSATEEEFYKKVGSLVNTVVKMYPFISGYCYTQLTDVEQEQNGLYYYDRKPKFDVQKLKEIFGKTPVEDYNKK